MKNYHHRKLTLWMQTAIAVAETGSPTRAVRILGVSITTIYRHLDALERSFGFKIFDRQQSGWTLREQASPLLMVGREIERLVKQAENDIRDAADSTHETLRIALSEEFAIHYVAPRLGAFCKAHKNIQPDLIVSSKFADLVYGEADVAIRPDRNPGDTLVGRRVGQISHALYASHDYIRQYGLPQTISVMNQHRFCGYSSNLTHYTAARWLEKNVKTGSMVARFGSTAAMTQAVAEGLGIGLIPCYVGDYNASLAPIKKIRNDLPVDIWLVTAAVNKKRSRVRAFFKFFAGAIRTDKNIFSSSFTQSD